MNAETMTNANEAINSFPIDAITIRFPNSVQMTLDDQRVMGALLQTICERYARNNPGRLLWFYSSGFVVTTAQPEAPTDEPRLDANVWDLELREGENAVWPCGNCGKAQGDHAHMAVVPHAGMCEYKPGTIVPMAMVHAGVVPMAALFAAEFRAKHKEAGLRHEIEKLEQALREARDPTGHAP